MKLQEFNNELENIQEELNSEDITSKERSDFTKK
jgi:hypothetical protein